MSDTKEESFATSIYSIRQDAPSLSIFSAADVTGQAPTSSPHSGVSASQRQAFITGFARSNDRLHQTSGIGLPISRSTTCGTIFRIAHQKQAGAWKRWPLTWAMY